VTPCIAALSHNRKAIVLAADKMISWKDVILSPRVSYIRLGLLLARPHPRCVMPLRDPVALLETKGTPEVHEIGSVVN
jgi:hypothetical protein